MFIMTSFDTVTVVKKSLETMETNAINSIVTPWQQVREKMVIMDTELQVTMDTEKVNILPWQPEGHTEEPINEFIPG